MNKKVVFDTSAFGKRVSAEIPEPEDQPKDPDVVIAMDEKEKLRREGKMTEKKKPDPVSIKRQVDRSKSIEEIHEMLDGKMPTTHVDEYIVNHSLVKKMVEMNIYINSVRHLAELCGFFHEWQQQTSVAYQALLGNTYKGKYKTLTKEQMKKLARALKFNNWKVLIHPDIKTSENETKRKNKAYLDEIAKIEAEFNEK